MAKKKQEQTGWRTDLEDAKSHIDILLNGGVPKDVLNGIINHWSVYHEDEKNKLKNYLVTAGLAGKSR